MYVQFLFHLSYNLQKLPMKLKISLKKGTDVEFYIAKMCTLSALDCICVYIYCI